MDRIAYGHIGAGCYNFWQGEGHVRGVIRRTSLTAFTDVPDSGAANVSGNHSRYR